MCFGYIVRLPEVLNVAIFQSCVGLRDKYVRSEVHVQKWNFVLHLELGTHETNFRVP